MFVNLRSMTNETPLLLAFGTRKEARGNDLSFVAGRSARRKSRMTPGRRRLGCSRRNARHPQLAILVQDVKLGELRNGSLRVDGDAPLGRDTENGVRRPAGQHHRVRPCVAIDRCPMNDCQQRGRSVPRRSREVVGEDIVIVRVHRTSSG